MKKKLLCSLLCVGMLVPSVLAAESFSDVPAGSWYADAVTVCADAGLLKGDGKGNFLPDNTITLAETATIAARMLSERTGTAIPDKAQGEAWYQPYVTYLADNGVTVGEPTQIATRAEFFQLLAAVTDRNDLTPINSITVLPDTADADILAFYNAGILTGTDKYGTFSGDKTLRRSEVAAMVARILEPSLRQSFVPLELPAQTADNSTVMTVNGRNVSAEKFQYYVCQVAYDLDYQLYYSTGARLDWTKDYGVGDTAQYVLSIAQTEAVYQAIAETLAEELDCELSGLAEALTPSPSKEELKDFSDAYGLLCAKHILVEDEQTASAVLDGLEAVPTLDQFNALLMVFGTDPGMEQNPDGYLFSSGEMVSEFEEGTRSLEIGTYSKEPVQSQFGYHIIWRLDPVEHPDLVDSLRQQNLSDLLDALARQAEVTVDTAAIGAMDAPALYEAFWSSLS